MRKGVCACVGSVYRWFVLYAYRPCGCAAYERAEVLAKTSLITLGFCSELSEARQADDP